MTAVPPSDLKPLAGELAAFLANADGSGHILRLMNRLGLFADSSAPAKHATVDGSGSPEPPVLIGIWQAEEIAGETHFVRAPKLSAEWRWWADVDRIAPKRTKKRIVLIGESVAYGWSYAPVFTPAKALQHLVASLVFPDEVEVIDLSRINMGLPQARELNALACAHLEPDVVVHFSGNNWHPLALLPPLARREYADLLKGEHGLARLIDQRKQEMAQRVGYFVDDIIAAAKDREIPLVFVLPDFNLVDWRDEWFGPWLENGKTGEWHRTRRLAEEALASGDISRAAALAIELIAWDGGTSGAGFAILARCRLQEGKVSEVRGLLEKAWDTLFLNPALSMPRYLAGNRHVLRERAARAEIPVVDLHAVFADHLGGELPDRRLFIDYCHLSVNGIKVAMAAVAAALAPHLGVATKPWRELVGEVANPPEAVELASRFMCAFQNSSLGQRDDLIARDLQPLVAAAPELMRVVLALCTQGAPIWMNREFAVLSKSDPGVLSSLILSAYGGESYVPLSQNLLDAALSVLPTDAAEIRRHTDEVLADAHGIGRLATDLLHPRHYQTSMLKRDFLWWEVDNAQLATVLTIPFCYYKAYEDESVFRFVARDAVRCSLTYRVPGGGEAVIIEVNGRTRITLAATAHWQTETFVIEPGELVAGRNRLRFFWPPLTDGASVALAAAAARIAQGMNPELFPVFGEIHAFTAVLQA